MKLPALSRKQARQRRRAEQLDEFEFHFAESVNVATYEENLWRMAFEDYEEIYADVTVEELKCLFKALNDAEGREFEEASAIIGRARTALEVEPELPPGCKLSRCLSLLIPRAFFIAYIQPAIAEWQAEYIEAIARGDEVLARAVRIRGCVWIAWPILYCVCRSVTGGLVDAVRKISQIK